jgi:hypothetical protein
MHRRGHTNRRAAIWASSLSDVRQWQLTRRQTREAKERLRETAEAESALALLRHSIACGHGKLMVRRYLLAAALDVQDLEKYAPQFAAAAQEFTAEELAKAVYDAKENARRLLAQRESSAAETEPAPLNARRASAAAAGSP